LTGELKRFEDLPPDDYRRSSPRFQGENFQKNLDLVKVVADLAAAHQVTSAQLALAWLLAKRQFIVPIPGTKRRKYLEQNVKAADLHLTAEDLRKLDAAFPTGAAFGARYPQAMMASTGR
jgi:aryl-alcohol dehydrogenase-like predicted oxidoreductase